MREKQIRPDIDALLMACGKMLDVFIAANALSQKDMHLNGRNDYAIVDFPCKLLLNYNDGKNICQVKFDLDFSDSKDEESFKLKFEKILTDLLKIINHSKNMVEPETPTIPTGGVTGLTEKINDPLSNVVFGK